MKKYDIDFSKLYEYESICERATPGKWDIWDGPAYCGGGRDLCIGAGEEWLANMDHRFGDNYDERRSHDSADDCSTVDCQICSMSDDVTREQRDNAVFVVKAKNDIIPWAFEEIKNLRWHYEKAFQLLKDIKEAYYEKFPPNQSFDWEQLDDETKDKLYEIDKLEALICKIGE